MNRYYVTISKTQTCTVEVWADNAAEASRIADDTWTGYMFDELPTGTIDYTILDVAEVADAPPSAASVS